MLETTQPLEIIDSEFIPALNRVGERFEKGEIFLPQLLLSAQAVQNGFEVISQHMQKSGGVRQTKGKILLATVYGDIHDIGKNIVSMLLANYGYEIFDLGRDVSTEDIIAAIKKHEIHLVGLSALMTTTVKNMKETIAAVRQQQLDCSFMVGGAVLNEDYAQFVGADFYAKDAMESVVVANRFFAEIPITQTENKVSLYEKPSSIFYIIIPTAKLYAPAAAQKKNPSQCEGFF